MDLQQVGERVRLERERMGLNQRELAARAGLSQPTLARVELGTRSKLTIAEIDRIAAVLDVPLRELTSGNPVRKRIRVAARVTPDAGETCRHALRRAVDILVLDDRLDRFESDLLPPKAAGRLAADLSLPDSELSGEEQGRILAVEAREALDLGGAPLADPAELVEWITGVDTAVADFPDGIDGFTITDPVRGATLLVVGTRAVPERQRFTFCHELGHLLFGDGAQTHEIDGARTPAEKRCDAFARHLLAPQEGIRAWLGEQRDVDRSGAGDLDERACALLGRHFGVSLMVILIQLEHMGLLSRRQVDALRGPTGAQLARRYGWARQYECELETSRTIRPPRRVLERATRAYQTGKVGVRVLAGLEGTDPAELEAALAEAGIAPSPVQIRRVDLGSLVARTSSGEAGSADLREAYAQLRRYGDGLVPVEKSGLLEEHALWLRDTDNAGDWS